MKCRCRCSLESSTELTCMFLGCEITDKSWSRRWRWVDRHADAEAAYAVAEAERRMYRSLGCRCHGLLGCFRNLSSALACQDALLLVDAIDVVLCYGALCALVVLHHHREIVDLASSTEQQNLQHQNTHLHVLLIL